MEHDKWLDPLRKKREFKELLAAARERHEQAARVFSDKHGNTLLSH